MDNAIKTRGKKGFFVVFLVLTASFVFLFVRSTLSEPVTMEIWLTDGNNTEFRLKQLQDRDTQPGIGLTTYILKIGETTQYQQIDGFGASLTDSAAWLIHESLSELQYNETLEELFGSNGIGISFLRLALGASDCALSWYTYDDTSPDLSDFSIAHDEAYVIPLLKDALALNPNLKIMGTPFSAPGWMKYDNNQSDPATKGLIGGRLQPQYYEMYAEYFVKFIQAYKTHGIMIDAITIQNEPYHEPSDYPGMLMNVTEQTRFIIELGMKFQAQNITTKILMHDHNWDLEFNVRTVLGNQTTRQFIDGIAWHGYSSPNPAVQSAIHEDYPDIDHYFTEVTGFKAAPNFNDNLVWNMQNIFIGTMRNWARTALLWNLALDSQGGPILRPYYDMRGVITIDNSSESEGFSMVKEVEYYAIGQMSKFIHPGAFRIDSTTYPNRLESVAFKNPDGSKVVVALNPNDTLLKFKLEWNNRYMEYSIPPKSVCTIFWD